MSFSDTAPKLSDSDNNLLFKIAQILNSGGGNIGGGTLSLDGTFAANSDSLYPSQKATKVYANTKVTKAGDTGLGTMTWGADLASINSNGSASFAEGGVVFNANGSGILSGGEISFSTSGVLTVVGLTLPTAAKLSITSGANQRAGNAVLVGGTVTIANTTVTANTVIMLTRKTAGGTIGTSTTYTVSAGASFTITSSSVIDTSTFSYLLIEVP